MRGRQHARAASYRLRFGTCAAVVLMSLGIVLAGGAGKRLAPLTDDRAKPAVPFGGNYRLVDFVLSNLVERRDPADRRPHAVQEPQPRPAHHPDLADVLAARQLRHAGAGASSGWDRAGTPAAPMRSSRA